MALHAAANARDRQSSESAHHSEAYDSIEVVCLDLSGLVFVCARIIQDYGNSRIRMSLKSIGEPSASKHK